MDKVSNKVVPANQDNSFCQLKVVLQGGLIRQVYCNVKWSFRIFPGGLTLLA